MTQMTPERITLMTQDSPAIRRALTELVGRQVGEWGTLTALRDAIGGGWLPSNAVVAGLVATYLRTDETGCYAWRDATAESVVTSDMPAQHVAARAQELVSGVTAVIGHSRVPGTDLRSIVEQAIRDGQGTVAEVIAIIEQAEADHESDLAVEG